MNTFDKIINESLNDLIKDIDVDNIITQLHVPQEALDVAVASLPNGQNFSINIEGSEDPEDWGIPPNGVNKDGTLNDLGIKVAWGNAVGNMADEMHDRGWEDSDIEFAHQALEGLSIPTIKALIDKFYTK